MEPARLNVTYAGQQGELPDPIDYDTPDAQVRALAAEALRTGIPGVDPINDPDLSDFVVERFAARDDIPHHRVSIRPKTAFG